MPNATQKKKYVIEQIHDYDRVKGYLVSWKGYPDSDRSWQKARDMPAAYKHEMELARLNRNETSKSRASDESNPEGETRRPFGAVIISTKETPDAADDLWIISEVISYDPKKGYFVSWNGCDESANSWQAERDMPDGCREDMRLAREKYNRDKRKKVVVKKPRESSLKRNVTQQSKTSRPSEQSSDPKTVVTPKKPKVGRRKTRRAQDIIKSITKYQQKKMIREVHSVVQFDPSKGYLVHWKQTKPSEDSWLSESELGAEFRDQMRLASERYCDSLI